MNTNGERVQQIPVAQIHPNPWNRSHVDQEALKELAASIASVGVLMPILVRPFNGEYQTIAGERRVQACKKLGMKTIPALVKEMDPGQAQQEALIENIQREDIDPITEAQGYQRLLSEFQLTQAALAKRLGKTEGYIGNFRRILSLPKEILEFLRRLKISYNHALQLLRLPSPRTQLGLAKKIVAQGLSVAQTKARVDASLGVPRGRRAGRQTRRGKGSTASQEHLRDKWGRVGQDATPNDALYLNHLPKDVRLIKFDELEYTLMIPIHHLDTDLGALLRQLAKVVEAQRKAWLPMDQRIKVTPEVIQKNLDTVRTVETVAKAAKRKGLTGDAALTAGLQSAYPSMKITSAMIANLKKASQYFKKRGL